VPKDRGGKEKEGRVLVPGKKGEEGDLLREGEKGCMHLPKMGSQKKGGKKRKKGAKKEFV